MERPRDEWIEIEGASPRIVDESLWQRVQQILEDPERIKRRPSARFYLLRGRTKCGICGSAMVGQSLTVKGRPFRYYRCRHVYDKNTARSCTARYVRGDKLESAVWHEVSRVLSNPSMVLQELERRATSQVDEEALSRLKRDLADITQREERLVRLYALGKVDESVIQREMDDVARQRQSLEAKLLSLESADDHAFASIDETMLKATCAAVAAWLDDASEEDRTLALEALQVAVKATKESAWITGVLPVEPPSFVAEEHSSRCSCNGDVAREIPV